MNFIKNIVDGKKDNFSHIQFQKFSRGEFRNKALVKVKRSGKKFTLLTSPEFANELVREVAKKLGNKKTKVSGAIVSTQNLKEDPIFERLLAHAAVKQFQGVKRYLLNEDLSGDRLIELLDSSPKHFFALSFDAEDGETTLKIKPKAPKSSKPKNKEESPKPDFCKLVTKDEELIQSFIFERPKLDFKEANINHTFFVKDIIISEELKKTKDFARMREEAERKGTILRFAEIDEIKTEKEFPFQV
jgi:hypothetical protein